jgi:hypothetical protein
MTDEQLRRADSRKARDAFDRRVDALVKEMAEASAGLNMRLARIAAEDALKREIRIAWRRRDREDRRLPIGER